MLPFAQHSKRWKALLDLPRDDHYRRSDLCSDEFRLFSDSGLDAYYIPFHHLNAKSRIVVVGVTPCWTQMERAFAVAKQGLADGLEKDVLFEYIDRTGRFNGPMRWNLIEMLDGIGLQNSLGMESCAALFKCCAHLAHFTSAVTAPLFKGEQNYSGAYPKMLKVPKLRDFILETLAGELASLPNAVIIPLGDVPGEAIQLLHGEKLITLDRCLFGFPHPSVANGRRRLRYDQGRKRWSEQLQALFPSRVGEISSKLRVPGPVSLRSDPIS